MNQKIARQLSKVAGNKHDKRTMKKFYKNLTSDQKGKFNSSLKLFIKEKNESTIQKN